MTTLTKIALDQAADWDIIDHAPFVLEAMLDHIAFNDRVGLTRIDRAGAAGGEHAWRAGIYHGRERRAASNELCAPKYTQIAAG
ncbi:MAG: hypothetical protein M3R61_00545 [Chloroflexota bacterium]|nr:hypothetical protein [Chloroflexota bacterium]